MTATLLAARGDLAAADDAAERAYDLHQRTQVYAADLARHLVALHLSEQRGELATAATDADGVAALDDHGDLYQARVAAAAGAALVKEHIAARVEAVLAEQPAWHRVSRLAVIGHLVADVDLTDLVPAVEHALDPYASELVAAGTALVCAGPVTRVLARLAVADGRPAAAVDLLRDGLAAAEATGLHGWMAPIAADLARASHAVGDDAGATHAAATAIQQARRCGQPGIASRAAASMAATSEPPASSAPSRRRSS